MWLTAAVASDDRDAALEFLQPLRGESGSLQAVFRAPGEAVVARPPPGTMLRLEDEHADEPSHGRTPLVDAGIYAIRVEVGNESRKAEHLRLIRLVPFSRKHEGWIGRYEIGFWPLESEVPPRVGAYATPAGFVEVTRGNGSTHVSKHFKLEDFLSKGNEGVWPRYLVLDPRLPDKLELVIQALKAAGQDVHDVHVMSGFRTPLYNEGGGDTRGRGRLSRHIYGDAADIWIDDDGDGLMDDLNGDRRIDIADAEVIVAAGEHVEAQHPSLTGGLAAYPACCNHGPFVHVDTRGSRARWRGTEE